MGALAELNEILSRVPRRAHYIYHERKQGALWVFTHRAPCYCHINENHWIERKI